jgi:intracellular sulfur oxidation DsrE/DsrF family protein
VLAYQKKFNYPNPNADLLIHMQKVGMHFVFCGQTMNIRGIDRAELYNTIFISEAAKVALTKYQTAGYILFAINGAH